MATSTTATNNTPPTNSTPTANTGSASSGNTQNQGISSEKAKAGWNTIMQHASKKGPASLREEAKGR